MADSWAQVILSNPTTVACSVHGEKGGARIEVPLPNPFRLLRCSLSRALLQISNPVRSGNGSAVDRAEDFIPYQQSKLISKVHSTTSKCIKANENEVEVSAWFTNLSKMLPKHENWVGTIVNSISTRTLNHSGANDDDMYLG